MNNLKISQQRLQEIYNLKSS
jgi:hypothetical protein